MNRLDEVLVDHVTKSFTNKEKSELVLDDISFRVKRGELISILGQSGCGKSTLLNMIGGFEKPDSGMIRIGGTPVERPSRRCIMLFQNYGLLPWRSVLKNVELGLEELSLPPKEQRERAQHYLRLVGLDDKTDLFPHQLSGGMQQRVALARALAIQPELILMDEPFAALDTFTRYYLQDELLRIQTQEKTTIVLVTHDIDEAIYLSDRIFIMSTNKGQIYKEIVVNTSRPRDRGHSDFQHFRKQIFEQFQFNGLSDSVEYSI